MKPLSKLSELFENKPDAFEKLFERAAWEIPPEPDQAGLGLALIDEATGGGLARDKSIKLPQADPEFPIDEFASLPEDVLGDSFTPPGATQSASVPLPDGGSNSGSYVLDKIFGALPSPEPPSPNENGKGLAHALVEDAKNGAIGKAIGGNPAFTSSDFVAEYSYLASAEMPNAVAGPFDMAYQKPSGVGGGGGGGGRGGGEEPSTNDPNALFATYTSGASDVYDQFGILTQDNFNVEIQFYGTWDTAFMDAFAASAEFLSSIMTQGLWNDPESFNTFDPFGTNLFEVDDVLIEARMSDIDGVGGVLGGANVFSVRDATAPADAYTTVVGYMEFDNADAAALIENATWDDVVLHEMVHALGFGTLWDNYFQDLITQTTTQVAGQNTRSPRDDEYESTAVYNGEFANAVFNEEMGSIDQRIEVETDGGSGTALAHWDEQAYGDEAMTGYLDTANGAYMADWSLAALADIGYHVDIASFSGADKHNELYDGIDLEDPNGLNNYALVDASDGTLFYI